MTESNAVTDPGVVGPVTIARQGHFWVGMERTATDHGTALTGQMYVQYQTPADVRRPYPVVMVHGGGGQGLDYLGTPDGRPGWATAFLSWGWEVYVVDRPACGRAPYHPDLEDSVAPAPTLEFSEMMFTAPEAHGGAPDEERVHTRWPGTGRVGDPTLDQIVAGQRAVVGDLEAVERSMASAGIALLDRIGPAVLLTASLGGPFGWLVADARPELVRGIVACEPIGPPFMDSPSRGGLRWGVTATPITYQPPVADPNDLQTVPEPVPGSVHGDGRLFAEPAPRLPNLAGIPIAVVTARSSRFAAAGLPTVTVLRQAGCAAELLPLEEHGADGYGHMMMIERDNIEIAALLDRWLENRVRSGGA